MPTESAKPAAKAVGKVEVLSEDNKTSVTETSKTQAAKKTAKPKKVSEDLINKATAKAAQSLGSDYF